MSSFAPLEVPESSPVRNGTNGHPPPPAPVPAEILVLKTAKPQTPRDRWETAFMWGFITRFTGLKGSVDGLESVME